MLAATLSRLARLAAGSLLLLSLAAAGPAAAAPHRQAGAVYVQTNAAGSNAVAVFARAGDGRLTFTGTVATGGLGTGSGLGSQGALAASADGRWLFAVDAGSDQISTMRVAPDGALRLVGVAGSGGDQPTSLTVHGRLLYVLNAGGPPNVTGFVIGPRGGLAPLAGSTRPLSAADVAAAEVRFSPDGDHLVVSEKSTSLLDVYPVGRDGRAGPPRVQPSAGTTPFGFAFDPRGHLIVSETFGGAAGASAASSYRLRRDGRLVTVSASAPTAQTFACWVAVAPDGRRAYTANTGSNSVTAFRVARDGSLARLDADGRTGLTGNGPSDLDLSGDGRYLYNLNGADGTVTAFAVAADGHLRGLGTTGGLPARAAGLVVR
jgi:6-phosphogluconolactonase (cycloisomerase 2 family)